MHGEGPWALVFGPWGNQKMDKRIRKVMIVSLSRGILGETFVQHEVELGLRRLENMGLEVSFAPNALKGLDYLEKHPEKRAEDLLYAFSSDADMILCAIGGDDTYRLLPYLFDHNELENAVSDKVFLGFSDTTMNHLMLHKVGMRTFYGQAFLPDVCEISSSMLPYTFSYFEELVRTAGIRRITPSAIWYEGRKDYSSSQVGTEMRSFENEGFVLLQGKHSFRGKILGGCIDSMYDIFSDKRYSDTVSLCSRYELFPSPEDWKDRILLIETSEEQPCPELFRKQLTALRDHGVFDNVSGVLVGKPLDGLYYREYNEILSQVIDDESLPVVVNVNIGHATPRCIIPFGVDATVDTERQEILFG